MSDTSTTNQTRGEKAAATRKRNATRRAAAGTKNDARRTATSARETAQDAQATAAAETKVRFHQAQQLAERAVLVPVGASLLVRDTLVSTVTGIGRRFASRESVGEELQRYERRGAKARKGLETQVRRTRRSLEREVSHRRSGMERQVKAARERIGSIAP